jgi:hypothetical protein
LRGPHDTVTTKVLGISVTNAKRPRT